MNNKLSMLMLKINPPPRFERKAWHVASWTPVPLSGDRGPRGPMTQDSRRPEGILRSPPCPQVLKIAPIPFFALFFDVQLKLINAISNHTL